MDNFNPTSIQGTLLASDVWGGTPTNVSQDFGLYDAATASMYAYAADVGWPAGTHVGIDVAVPKGTPIYAAEDGIVTESYKGGGIAPWFRPRPVTIETKDGHKDIYGHLERDAVDVDQKVVKGQLIGWSGEQTKSGTLTPDGTGPHIHFERRNKAGKAVNPVPVLQEGGGGFTDCMAGCMQNGFFIDMKCYLECLKGAPGDAADAGGDIAGDALPALGPLAGRAGLFVAGLVFAIGGFAFLMRGQIAGATPIGRALKLAKGATGGDS